MNANHPRSKDKVIHFSKWTDSDHDLYDERTFQELLRIERKRSERSGRPFLLMLIDIEKSVQNETGKTIIGKIICKLNTHTRETDAKGWFVDKSIIGIIFTEIGEHDKAFILERITQRVRNSLFYVLESNHFQEMKLSLQWFPDNGNQSENNYEPNSLFYPDVIQKAIHKVFSLFIKRLIDIAGSITGLIIFSPLFITIPILIKLTSKGPVFFRQERLGLSGQKFTFLKFRSMHINHDDNIHREYIKSLIANGNDERRDDEITGQDGIYKIKEDPRITLIGKFLRKTSLDELPQFINVLKGDMSLVGHAHPYRTSMKNIKCGTCGA